MSFSDCLRTFYLTVIYASKDLNPWKNAFNDFNASKLQTGAETCSEWPSTSKIGVGLLLSVGGPGCSWSALTTVGLGHGPWHFSIWLFSIGDLQSGVEAAEALLQWVPLVVFHQILSKTNIKSTRTSKEKSFVLFVKTPLAEATHLYRPEQPALCYVKAAVLC